MDKEFAQKFQFRKKLFSNNTQYFLKNVGK